MREHKKKKNDSRKCIVCKIAVMVVMIVTMGVLIDKAIDGISSKVIPTSGNLKETKNWGLGGFGTDGKQPTGTASVEEMKKYNAYYMGGNEEKIIYLTFDCGYENGNTTPILDALKKHKAPGTFFVVGHFLESAPELVKRMIDDGHTVGNHTFHHPDMAKISDENHFKEELDRVSEKFKEVTGKEIASYYRPPQGKYNINNLKMADKLGYKTFFWSLAYADWNQDKQPSRETALTKLTERVHPGAVVLLHNTSKTNGDVLDELLTKWEEMGYQFKPLSDLIDKNNVKKDIQN